jgi:hypothetical protein
MRRPPCSPLLLRRKWRTAASLTSRVVVVRFSLDEARSRQDAERHLQGVASVAARGQLVVALLERDVGRRRSGSHPGVEQRRGLSGRASRARSREPARCHIQRMRSWKMCGSDAWRHFQVVALQRGAARRQRDAGRRRLRNRYRVSIRPARRRSGLSCLRRRRCLTQ